METPGQEAAPPTRRAAVAVGIGQVSTVPFRMTPCDLPHAPRRCLVLVMPREIDIANIEELDGEMRRSLDLRRGRIDVLVLDFTGTSFTDSRGARFISATLEYAGRSGVAVRLAAGEGRGEGGAVRRVITLTGLRRDVPVYGSVAEAVAGVDELGLRVGGFGGIEG
ncbi:STAS domain-containing protein [Streptomyces sp. NPDC051561]|uniref:STAS domain-containing protein n=1 Tax=Streptomyces sp. NPDC051561 TaxID=3365658 RepID=UPI003789DD2B